ncbi:porin family protein [Psychroserpens sp. SPM9]|uniref:porin family protein n=1 Tax=Psychroserpens sp. SPM9 TaxID=2975598 RepID=UPI0021A5AB45|nr:porin family protein [Psychroserpens sp. SPM9]MDG5491950.1 porin family protein [Psychroserpens sp. SPM9]
MKRILLIAITFVGFTTLSNAQDISDNAIGVRLGDSDGFGAEISYQRGLGDNNRLEIDLGLRSGNNYDGFKLTGLYQWVWNIDGGFNWYAGAGGGVGSYSFDNVPDGFDDSETFLFVAGDVGIEYNFDFPLQLSLDARPELGFGDYRDDLDFDIALGIRYRF